MEVVEHINRIQHQLHLLERQGHITEPDEMVRLKDTEIALYELRKSFEQNDKIKLTKP